LWRCELIILLLLLLHEWAERGTLLDPNYFLLVRIFLPLPFLVLLEEVNNQYFSLREVICLSSGNCDGHDVMFMAAEV
jgi:hypothetical protein